MGGAESTYAEFEPNPFIRCDTNIPPGRYKATAYRTDFPDDMIDRDLRRQLGAKGARVLDYPGTIVMSTVGLAFASWILVSAISGSGALGLACAVAAVVGGRLWYRSHTDTDEFKRLTAQNLEMQREYPSIAIRLEMVQRV